MASVGAGERSLGLGSAFTISHTSGAFPSGEEKGACVLAEAVALLKRTQKRLAD